MTNSDKFMNRRGFLQASLLGIFASSPLSQAFGAAPITFKLLGAPTSNSFSLSISTNTAVRVFIEYGYNKNVESKTSVVSLESKTSRTFRISNLKSNTSVYYRVKYALAKDSKYQSLALKNLKTSPAQALSSNTFAIQADPHMDQNSSAEVYEGTLRQIVAAAPAFLMDLGDIFMVDKLPDKSEANIRGRFELMKGFYNKLGNIPLKICLGNHDGELGYSKFNTKNYRKEYFPEQTGELAYFSFTGPDQLHVVLDPFTYTTKNPTPAGWEWTLGKTQYDWLVQTLQNSKEKHKFIYIHHLLVGDPQSRGGVEIAGKNEWGGKNVDGTYGFDTNRPGWGKPIHQLLIDYNVGFVFKGHDHLYVKQELDGIIYQTLPQPSHPGDKINVNQYGYISGKGVGGSGFLKVSTSGNTATVDFILHDGKVADSYSRSL